MQTRRGGLGWQHILWCVCLADLALRNLNSSLSSFSQIDYGDKEEGIISSHIDNSNNGNGNSSSNNNNNNNNNNIAGSEGKRLQWIKLSKKTRPKIFYCAEFSAFESYQKVFTSVFPEYEWTDISLDRALVRRKKNLVQVPKPSVKFQPYDITVNHFEQRCEHSVYRWYWQLFPGITIFVTPESDPRSRPFLKEDVIEMGPNFDRIVTDHHQTHQNHSNYIPFNFLQVTFWSLTEEQRQSIIQPSFKPKSSHEHGLVYANSNCVIFREQAFLNFSTVFPPDRLFHAGGCRGNRALHGHNLSTRFNNGVRLDDHVRNSHVVYNHFKFCLVLEHDNLEGYITEKLLLAFLGGCIPIYFGTERVFDVFHRESFVFYDRDNPLEAVHRVQQLDNSTELYDQMWRQPILANGNETIRKHFSFDDNYGGGYLKHLIRSKVGIGSKFDFIV